MGAGNDTVGCELVVGAEQVNESEVKKGVTKGVEVEEEFTEVVTEDKEKGAAVTVEEHMAVSTGPELTGRESEECLGRLC